MATWADADTLAEVDYQTGRLVSGIHLGRAARISYSEHPMIDTQTLSDGHLNAVLSPPPTWLRRWGGRKFLLALAVLASVTALSWLGRVDATAYTAVAIAVVGLYGAANVAKSATTKAPAQ